jgi:glycosyltransferase involved in cell wall biosynthesis
LLTYADLRKQLGEAGRARVAEHFGVDRLVDGTLDVYRKFSRD